MTATVPVNGSITDASAAVVVVVVVVVVVAEVGVSLPHAAAAPAERRVWALVKDARSAQAVERAHPLGRELRVLL